MDAPDRSQPAYDLSASIRRIGPWQRPVYELADVGRAGRPGLAEGSTIDTDPPPNCTDRQTRRTRLLRGPTASRRSTADLASPRPRACTGHRPVTEYEEVSTRWSSPTRSAA
jgi:hypothetical protein